MGKDLLFKFTFLGKEKDIFVLSFLKKNFFEHVEMKDFLLLNEKSLLVVGNKNTSSDMLQFKKNFNPANNKTLFLIPTHLKFLKLANSNKIIYYPTNFLKLQEYLKKYFYSKESFFKELSLLKNNYLENNINSKKIYLTETEVAIIRALFSENKLKKEKLKTDILKLKTTVITKSLESHLSRIRKKISELGSNVEIISMKDDYVIIT